MMMISHAQAQVKILMLVDDRLSLPSLSISVSLNLLLILMIVVRLVLHGRNIRVAAGSPLGISGLYRTSITMLIESSALYTVSSFLVIGPVAAGSLVMDVFFPILAETQVCASHDRDTGRVV